MLTERDRLETWNLHFSQVIRPKDVLPGNTFSSQFNFATGRFLQKANYMETTALFALCRLLSNCV